MPKKIRPGNNSVIASYRLLIYKAYTARHYSLRFLFVSAQAALYEARNGLYPPRKEGRMKGYLMKRTIYYHPSFFSGALHQQGAIPYIFSQRIYDVCAATLFVPKHINT